MLAGLFECQAKREPSWMKELPLPGNNTYIYVRESGEGTTIDAALNMALVRVFQNTASRLGRTVDTKKIGDALAKGTSYISLSQQYNIPINKVDQYDVRLKNGNYWVCVLCQVASMSSIEPTWDKGERSSNVDNAASMFKSVLPGLGQMGKGHYGEGVLTLVGETALVGGAVSCYVMAQDQYDIMNANSQNAEVFFSAMNRYNSLQTTQYILWGAAGALYIFNFVRAFTLEPKVKDDLSFAPSLIATPYTVSPTVGLTFRF